MEYWEYVKGFESKYQISTKGRVWNLKQNREIKPHMSGVERRNYPQVTLYKDGKKFTKRVHSLMAVTFLGHNYGDRRVVVDHKDNNPLNNNLNNLQIISMKENSLKDR